MLLVYEGGYLSIESGEVTAVMNATGEWQGRATFSPDILRALVMVPSLDDPFHISYDDGHLLIGNIIIICQWNTFSQAFIHDLTNPNLIDLLALRETLPRSEIGGTEIGKKTRSAHEKAERRILNAAMQLQDFEITEAEIRQLVEKKVKSHLETKIEPYDIFYDIAYILFDLAIDYQGDAKGELVNLAERFKTDKGIPESIRVKSINDIEKAISRLRMNSEFESVKYAASILFEIYKAVYRAQGKS